jgi:hypothetical protein
MLLFLNTCDSAHWRKLHVGGDPTRLIDGDISKHEHNICQAIPSPLKNPPTRATIYPRPITNSCKCSEKRDSIVSPEWLSVGFCVGSALSYRLQDCVILRHISEAGRGRLPNVTS